MIDTLLRLLDPPRGQESWVSADPRFQHAIDLVTYIRQSEEYSSNFCIGVAGAHRRDCLYLYLAPD